MPAVGDSKRAIDEYYSEICMGGRSVINIFNECEVREPSCRPDSFHMPIPDMSLLRPVYRTRSWRPL